MFVVHSYRDHIAINFDDGGTMLWRAALVGHSTFEAVVYAPPVEAPPDVRAAWAEAGRPSEWSLSLRGECRWATTSAVIAFGSYTRGTRARVAAVPQWRHNPGASAAAGVPVALPHGNAPNSSNPVRNALLGGAGRGTAAYRFAAAAGAVLHAAGANQQQPAVQAAAQAAGRAAIGL